MELVTLVSTCEAAAAAAAAAAAEWAAMIPEYCHMGERIPAKEKRGRDRKRRREGNRKISDSTGHIPQCHKVQGSTMCKRLEEVTCTSQ